MPDTASFAIFLSAAIALAVTPGPSIFYVLTRSIKGGRTEGYASASGTGLGGMFHVLAAGLGVSAILASSALAFNVLKYLGALYLVYLGLKTLLSHEDTLVLAAEGTPGPGNHAFLQGITTEALNPKTALFFLAFIPQFINPQGNVIAQFILLGCISVLLNTSVDFIVATLAGPIGQQLKKRALLRRGQRLFSGFGLIGLGVYVALTGNHKQTT